jgi:hypothetical protein
MSSWKHYGGINNLGKINTNSLSVNSLLMKEPFVGVFNISGGLTITGSSDNTTLYNNLNVYGNSNFYGAANFNQKFSALGNLDSSNSANISNNIILGNILYFDNGKSQFIYGNSSGLGINTITPNAALDISTNLIKGFNIYSNNIQNINTLAQNNQQKGLQIGVDNSSSFIHFFHDNTIQSGIIDGNISFNDGGIFNIDVKENINLLAPVSISDTGRVSHVNGETVVIYHISNDSFFDNIYNNSGSGSGSGSALSLISNDTSSNTFMYITTPNRKGLGIGGGAYPDDLNKSMGTIGMVDMSGIYTPTQMFVSGNNKVKYKTTTGINTFKPRIDNYVLDINGPIHIDNGDITNVTGNINFELYSMSLARNYPNNLIALGSPYEIDIYDVNNNIKYYKEQLLKSIDYGKTWNLIDIPYTDLLGVDSITSIHMYDQSYCFLTGQSNYLRYSIDGGMNWNQISNSLDENTFNHFFVNPKQNDTNGNIFCYFSVDLSSTFFSFKTNITENLLTKQNTIFSNNYQPYSTSCNNYIDSINGIHGYDKTLYVAGNAILKYNIDTTKYQTNDTSWTSFVNTHNYSSGSNQYIYNGIYAFDNSFVIAVGNNIISSTTDGGIYWNDISLNSMNGGNGVNLKSVYIYDSSYAVSVGSYGNIWITNNSGLTWNYMPSNLLNSSGKSSLITSNNNYFKHVIMPDINTMIISNIITPYIKNDTFSNGVSNIYNVFIPNFINRSNNIVLDISGTVNISGDLKISDNGDFVSNNPTMNIFNKNVKTINFGRATETINVGNTLLGNTIIQNNLITNGNATFINTIISTNNAIFSNILVNQTSLLNGNIGINIKPTNYTLDISGNIYTRSGLYVFNKLGVNTTNPNYDVDISGITNIRQNLFVLSDVSMNANVYIKGNSVHDSLSSFNSGIIVKNSDITVTGNIYGNIYPFGSNSLTIGGSDNDIYIGGYKNVNRPQKIFIGQNSVYPDPEKKSTIYLGSDTDSIILRGKATFAQVIDQVVTSSTIVLNKTGIGANASSGGAGIDIYDNSYSNIIDSRNYGYMHVGRDLQSFVFKAPSYGAYNNENGVLVPYPKSNYDISLISQENRLRLGVNELKLAQNKYVPTSGNVRSGLLVLQTNEDFIQYQGSHAYYNNANDPDADYAINISNAFDISNIMLKMFDTVSGTQSISSNLVIGNSTIPYDLSVYGNTILYKNAMIDGNISINGNSIIVGNSTVYGNTQIYGNTNMSNVSISNSLVSNGNILLFGNIGIGTNSPQMLLDVSGNSRFIGQVVNTNYDSIQFSKNYANAITWKDNSNKATGNTYYQDIATSYDSQFQYAFLYDKYTNCSVMKSTNFGQSWTQITLNQKSNNIISKAVPNMTSNIFSITSSSTPQYLSSQFGTYIASGSSFSTGNDYFNAFDINTSTTKWSSSSPAYKNTQNDTNITNYVGTIFTNYIGTLNGAWDTEKIYGEYIQIELPYSFQLTNVSIKNDGTNSAVKTLIIVGSPNNSDWYILNKIDPQERIITQTDNAITSLTTTSPDNFLTGQYASNSYKYFRFIVAITWNYPSGGTDANASIKKIDMSGFVQNSTGSYSSTISASGNGKYVTIADQCYNNNSGNIYVSNDYGSTYTNTNVKPLQMDGSGIWQSVAISQNGLYQFAVISSSYGKGNIWKSTDYGNSWYDIQFGVINGFQSINVSSSGKYVTAVQSGSITNKMGNIWVSNDYGYTWTSSHQIYSYIPFNNGFLNQGSVDFNKIIAISVNGRYQTIIGLASSNNNYGGNANIWYNNNYGQGSWTDSGYSAPVITGKVSILSSVSMTGSGQYQAVSFIGGNSNIYSDVYGNVLKSTDYGVSWSDVNFKVPSQNGGSGSQYYGYLPKIVSSINGQYITGISKYESARTNSYNNNNNNSTQPAVGNIFTSIIPTSSQINTTQYFGSSHNGNTSQMHGFQLSVPTVNNSSLIMGYDTCWDANYINSVSQNGYFPLCLNSVGGSVGISKINPDPNYVLDISGNVLIGGTLNVGGPTVSTSTGTGAVIISGGVGIGGNVFIGGNLNASKDVSFNSNLVVGGPTVSTSTGTGAVIVRGGVGIGGNVFVGGNLNASKDVSFNSNLVVGGATLSTSTTSGALVVRGGVGIGGSLYAGDITSSGAIKTTAITDSTSYTTGALIVSGGAGIGGNVYLSTNTKGIGIIWGQDDSKIYDNGDLHMFTDETIHFDIGSSGGSALNDVLKITYNLVKSAVKVEGLSFNATSDYRLKQNIQLLNETNKSVDELKPIEYDLSGGKHDMGFLAHEVQDIFPFLVNGEKDGKEYQSINYNGFIALLVKEIKDLKKEMKILYDRNDELDKRNDELDKRNDELDKRLKLVENR